MDILQRLKNITEKNIACDELKEIIDSLIGEIVVKKVLLEKFNRMN